MKNLSVDYKDFSVTLSGLGLFSLDYDHKIFNSQGPVLTFEQLLDLQHLLSVVEKEVRSDETFVTQESPA